MLYVR